jgi:hypothetical protein
MLTRAAGTERRLQPRQGTPRRYRIPIAKLASVQAGVGETAMLAPRQHAVTIVDIGMLSGTLVAQPGLQPRQTLPDLGEPNLQRRLPPPRLVASQLPHRKISHHGSSDT